MNIAINTQLENYIQDLISSGSYKNSSQIVEEALTRFKEQKEQDILTPDQKRKKAWLIQKLKESEQDIKEGRTYRASPQIFAQWRKEREAQYLSSKK